jgi:hypothetical protein
MSAIATNHRPSNRRRHLLAVPATATVRADPRPAPRWSAVTIRLSVDADGPRLRRLAHMDSARPLSGQTLLAEQGGAAVAALSLADGRAIADPFVATADVQALLALRAEQLRSARLSGGRVGL